MAKITSFRNRKTAKYWTSDGAEHDSKDQSEAHELGLKLIRIVKDHAGIELERGATIALFTLAYHHDEVREAIRICKGER